MNPAPCGPLAELLAAGSTESQARRDRARTPTCTWVNLTCVVYCRLTGLVEFRPFEGLLPKARLYLVLWVFEYTAWVPGKATVEEILNRFWHNLIDRASGPMHLRLILQPLMATFFAVRAGLADGRQGRSAFLWTAITSPAHRRDLMRAAWKDIRKVFVLACVLDSIYQLIQHRGVYLGEMVIVALVLAITPYVLIRGPVARLTRRFSGDQVAKRERKRAA